MISATVRGPGQDDCFRAQLTRVRRPRLASGSHGHKASISGGLGDPASGATSRTQMSASGNPKTVATTHEELPALALASQTVAWGYKQQPGRSWYPRI